MNVDLRGVQYILTNRNKNRETGERTGRGWPKTNNSSEFHYYAGHILVEIGEICKMRLQSQKYKTQIIYPPVTSQSDKKDPKGKINEV